ncbi:MAG TPA: hypothetical protein VFE10_02655 [Phenylobacterium sp.]|nr:hypothetical protein [Phenylobacterium sp.]
MVEALGSHRAWRGALEPLPRGAALRRAAPALCAAALAKLGGGLGAALRRATSALAAMALTALEPALGAALGAAWSMSAARSAGRRAGMRRLLRVRLRQGLPLPAVAAVTILGQSPTAHPGQ